MYYVSEPISILIGGEARLNPSAKGQNAGLDIKPWEMWLLKFQALKCSHTITSRPQLAQVSNHGASRPNLANEW